jgi:hypothetical protein
MSGIVTFTKSLLSPVWLVQLRRKALFSAAPDLNLPHRHLDSPAVRAPGIVSTNPQNSGILLSAELSSFRVLSAVNRLIVAEEGVQSKGVILFPVEIFTRR